uniref:WD repeat domain 55 n=1 Tax=Equus caballus TaxID=9796 RepID=F7D0F8_HORSE
MDRTCEERPAQDGSDEEDPDSTEAPVRIRDTPEDIVLEAPASGLAFHPARDLLAAGDVDGDVFVFSYSQQEGETKELWSSGHHLKSCRAVVFSEDGQKLVTVSKDKAIHVLDVEQGRLERRISKAHSAPINSLLLVDENVLATGDDTGGIRLWDQRKEGPLMDMRQHEEYIADMALDPAKKLLLTASGDGCLGVFNIRRRRFELLSEPQSGDLTSVTIMKCGKKVVCGSSEGTIYLFNWNGFGATSDRFALRAESIDCMVPVTENLLCTGSTDGVIRLPVKRMGSLLNHSTCLSPSRPQEASPRLTQCLQQPCRHSILGHLMPILPIWGQHNPDEAAKGHWMPRDHHLVPEAVPASRACAQTLGEEHWAPQLHPLAQQLQGSPSPLGL